MGDPMDEYTIEEIVRMSHEEQQALSDRSAEYREKLVRNVVLIFAGTVFIGTILWKLVTL